MLPNEIRICRRYADATSKGVARMRTCVQQCGACDIVILALGLMVGRALARLRRGFRLRDGLAQPLGLCDRHTRKLAGATVLRDGPGRQHEVGTLHHTLRPIPSVVHSDRCGRGLNYRRSLVHLLAAFRVGCNLPVLHDRTWLRLDHRDSAFGQCSRKRNPTAREAHNR